MATPPRLVQLWCPICHAAHWEIDHDCRGPSRQELSYEERTYRCSLCGTTGTGYEAGDKSPPGFFLQPHPMYPMNAGIVPLDQLEAQAIRHALKILDGNVSLAAKRLGVGRATLYRKLASLGGEVPDA